VAVGPVAGGLRGLSGIEILIAFPLNSIGASGSMRMIAVPSEPGVR
jgi:hypothetical protein